MLSDRVRLPCFAGKSETRVVAASIEFSLGTNCCEAECELRTREKGYLSSRRMPGSLTANLQCW